MKKLITTAALFFALLSAFCQPTLTATEQAGTDLYKQGKIDDAIVTFKKALTENPQSLYSMNL